MVELRESGAVESSNPWNNAGTGHAALCELNDTPEGADGSIDIKKSVTINAQFEESKQFWAYLLEKGAINAPKPFINPVPHMSFVRGNSGIAFLKKRFEALRQHHAVTEMESVSYTHLDVYKRQLPARSPHRRTRRQDVRHARPRRAGRRRCPPG